MKVSRMDAFSVISLALEENKIDVANQILKIVSKSISNDKKKKTFSSYVDITNKEAHILKSIMPSINIYDKEEQEEWPFALFILSQNMIYQN